MSTVLESNDRGELRIPASLLGAGPRARFRLETEGDAIRLIREPTTAHSAQQRVQAFRDWVAHLPRRNGPAIPLEALRRENLYD